MGRATRQIPERLHSKLQFIRNEFNLSQSQMLMVLRKQLEEREIYKPQTSKTKKDDGLFRSSVSAYERGVRMPPYNILLAYSDLANVHLEVLVDDWLDMPPGPIPYRIREKGISRMFF